ncbi:hypothetical protein ACFOQM_09680 [Paenibacillus sp. GCM10012307]|uniref:Uncharacterized protein n=1 Tax=Paenibacillus roseus TaxID=2798579 RepID=A0A934MKX6_9BACL|nr:hypothetical protein [Paenibacillus roseus]MBJ6361555.1 hypothetical protein [Paenibacillus roseus]
MKKNFESLKEVSFEGKTLYNGGYAGGKDDTKARKTQFYVDTVKVGEHANHYNVIWDFEDFYKNEEAKAFEWPFPHAISFIEKNYLESNFWQHYSSSEFTPLNQKVSLGTEVLTLVNRPVKFGSLAGSLIYHGAAIDANGYVYHVYWNMYNMFDPEEIVMTVDNSRYCTSCLKKWTHNSENDACKHEWVDTLEI